MTTHGSEPTTTHEVERSYLLPEGASLPRLDELPGVAGTSSPRIGRLDAVYWDTADLRLAARGVRLRRRTGGGDAGWHVKLPGSSGVTEVHLPAGRAAKPVPKALASLVAAVARGNELAPVARINTVRTEVDLLDVGGEVLATVADDDVRGQALGEDAAPDRWRELEVELGPAVAAQADGGAKLLDAVEQALLDVGARPAEHPSKVGRVLGPAVPQPWPGAPQRLRRSAPAGDVVAAYLRDQVDALLAQDPRVRRDEPEGVHKMRVATRRMRATLRTFRPLLDRQVTDPIGVQLKDLAAVLGGVRDREVLLARLQGQVSGLPAELVHGPVGARIDSMLSADWGEARRAALQELESERYLALLDTLVALASAPPLADGANGRAADVLPGLVAKVQRRIARDLRRAPAAEDVQHRDELLHDARKLAKRLRYAGEALAPAFGSGASKLASRAEALQEILGEHQDSTVARNVLREMAVASQGANESAFTYGVLFGLESARGEATVEASAPIQQALLGTKVSRLLR